MEILLSSPGIFFALGVLLSRLNKHSHFSKEAIRFLSVYLVISIGLKGGRELQHVPFSEAVETLGIGFLIGAFHGAALFYSLRLIPRFNAEDGTSIAAHYGSVSVGTFMVAVTFLKSIGIVFESKMYLLLVAMECPAILTALALNQIHQTRSGFDFFGIMRKVFYHETIVALLAGLMIGTVANQSFLESLNPFYNDMFTGILTFFMLCMGMEAGNYWDQIRDVGVRFVWIGLGTQLLGSCLGLIAGLILGLSAGGVCLLMILMGSASYIAAPCVMRESLPTANNSAIFLLSLGITFPFNVLIGIKAYWFVASIVTS